MERNSNVPAVLRDIINSFAELPILQARIYAEALLHEVNVMAAETGPCPSCGADVTAGTPPTRYADQAVGPLHFTQYCFVCGWDAVEPVKESNRDSRGRNLRFEPDWDDLAKYGDI